MELPTIFAGFTCITTISSSTLLGLYATFLLILNMYTIGGLLAAPQSKKGQKKLQKDLKNKLITSGAIGLGVGLFAYGQMDKYCSTDATAQFAIAGVIHVMFTAGTYLGFKK